jgi:hypothetical protein
MARHSCLFRRRWPTSTDPRRTEPEVLHAAWSRSSAITTRSESAGRLPGLRDYSQGSQCVTGIPLRLAAPMRLQDTTPVGAPMRAHWPG